MGLKIKISEDSIKKIEKAIEANNFLIKSLIEEAETIIKKSNSLLSKLKKAEISIEDYMVKIAIIEAPLHPLFKGSLQGRYVEFMDNRIFVIDESSFDKEALVESILEQDKKRLQECLKFEIE